MADLAYDGRSTMLWALILVVALAIVFVKLGAYSVWMTILAVGLKVAMLAIAGLSMVLLWWSVFARKKHFDA
jgi:hypothetical protein